ncbi:LexA family protein [Larkinella arboricola]
MIEPEDRIDPGEIYRNLPGKRLRIPLFVSYVAAGFPNAAEHHIERVLDANDLLIHDKDNTYFVRVIGDSMIGDRIEPGDILVVDTTIKPAHGEIAVIVLDGDHAVKRIRYVKEMIILESSNPKYLPIYIHPGDNFRIFGKVTRVVFKPRRKS